MEYLIAAGIIALGCGILLLFTPNAFMRFCMFCDRVLFVLDEKLQAYQFSSGIVLVMVAVWLFFMAIRYRGMECFIHPIWIIVLALGLLYLFFPKWLVWISSVSNRVIFSTDKYVMGACRIAGTILLIASVYIFHAAYVLSCK